MLKGFTDLEMTRKLQALAQVLDEFCIRSRFLTKRVIEVNHFELELMAGAEVLEQVEQGHRIAAAAHTDKDSASGTDQLMPGQCCAEALEQSVHIR